MRFGSITLGLVLSSTALAQSTWTGNGSGNWSDTADWTGGVPDSASAVANLTPSANSTFIDVNESVFLGTLNISSSTYLYYLYGSSPLTLATTSGQAQLNNTAGNNIILAPVSLGNDSTLNISASTGLSISDSFSSRGINITKAGGGLLAVPDIQANSINITQGSVQVLSTANGSSAGLSVVHSFTLASGATLDLQNNSLIDDYSGGSPLATMTGEIANAYDGGKWDKPGITSGLASPALATTLGIGTASTLGITSYEGQPTPNTVIVKYTWLGDANMDGVVNAADITFMQQQQQQGGTGWTAGDFNYDGKINADDYALFMLGDARQTGMLGSDVPEPTLAGIAGAAFLLCERKRRSKINTVSRIP